MGSAHDEAGVAALKAAAEQRIAAGRAELDLGLTAHAGSALLPITSSRAAHLRDALRWAYQVLGFDKVADDAFRALVCARIIEPTSTIDSARVLSKTGVAAPLYLTLNLRLPSYAKDEFRQHLSKACAAHVSLGPATLVLYDVTNAVFRNRHRRWVPWARIFQGIPLEPQITVGLFTDASGVPVTVQAFEGNKAEAVTMLSVIKAFKKAHQLADITVVADVGMISEANQIDITAAGLTYILGARVPFIPDIVREWYAKHPDEAVPDDLILPQSWPASSREKSRGGAPTISTEPTEPGAR